MKMPQVRLESNGRCTARSKVIIITLQCKKFEREMINIKLSQFFVKLGRNACESSSCQIFPEKTINELDVLISTLYHSDIILRMWKRDQMQKIAAGSAFPERELFQAWHDSESRIRSSCPLPVPQATKFTMHEDKGPIA